MTLDQEMNVLSKAEFLAAMQLFLDDPPGSDHQIAYLRMMILKAAERGLGNEDVVSDCRNLTPQKTN